MNKELRTKIHEKYGKRCAYCGERIEYKNMQVDHITPKRNGGTDDINNLNPSCRLCNHYKRAMSIEQFRETITTLQSRLEKIYIFKVGIKHGLVRMCITEDPHRFYFERLKGGAQ
ncbi:MAG: HNH endonuclease signature motif containing protein [Rikenellaceae bacterium]